MARRLGSHEIRQGRVVSGKWRLKPPGYSPFSPFAAVDVSRSFPPFGFSTGMATASMARITTSSPTFRCARSTSLRTATVLVVPPGN